ncbi:MAG: EamA family transporter [Actinomycetaceae bacterium]|nr:EamA family transporter [Actinomycetaceae bacterium]
MRKPRNEVVAPALYVAFGITQYTGAALAVVLFTVMAPTTVAWWRIAISAVVLLAWRRPWRGGLTMKEMGTSAFFGIVMAGMNMAFYEAVARLDLGVAVSLEFLGPVAVAVLGSKAWTSRVAALIALVGVVLISGFGVNLSNPQIGWGIFWALLAGALWAGYIVIGQRIATTRSGLTSLSVGSIVGAVVYFPLAIPDFVVAFESFNMFATVVGVALLSTVIPYSIDQIVMGRLDAPTLALLTALLPATSAIVGAVILRQFPETPSIIGLICVSIAVWLASRPEPIRPPKRK